MRKRGLIWNYRIDVNWKVGTAKGWRAGALGAGYKWEIQVREHEG